MTTTAELKAQIAELKKQIEVTKIKEEKIQKQQNSRIEKLVGSIYTDLKDRLLTEVKMDSENCFKVSMTIDLAGNKFKDITHKKVARTKLIEKSKAIKLQSSDAPSVKKSSFKKGQAKLQG